MVQTMKTECPMAQKTALRPLGHRVLAKRLEAESHAKGGIILPESAKKKQETLEVIALGTGKKDQEGQCLSLIHI